MGVIDHRIRVFSAFFANYVLSRVGSGCWRGLCIGGLEESGVAHPRTGSFLLV